MLLADATPLLSTAVLTLSTAAESTSVMSNIFTVLVTNSLILGLLDPGVGSLVVPTISAIDRFLNLWPLNSCI